MSENKTSLQTLDDTKLKFNDPPSMVWIRVRDAVKLLCPGNPKLHNIGEITESIRIHSFQELPKYDDELGGIKAGNGRIEALAMMEKDGRYELPRGMAEDETGAWVMPLLVGVDARSAVEAKAYLVDSNNLVLSGGDFTTFDFAQMYDPQAYLVMLAEIAASDFLPTSIDGDDMDRLMASRAKYSHQGADKEKENGKICACPKCGFQFFS